MKVIDHTDTKWLSKVRRINGALTYSQDIVKYQIPYWEKVLGENDIISTCPRFTDVDIEGEYRVAIQYLHSYPYYGAVDRISDIIWNKKFKAERMIFITAYKEFEKQLNEYGIQAVYIPMSIDVESVSEYIQPKIYDDRIIYFGNIVHNKLSVYNKIQKHCQMAGLKLDTINCSKFNNEVHLSRTEILRRLSEYKYGIGVGRCVQELYALNVKPVIAGHKFGGLVTSHLEYTEQLRTNLNGRICTYSDNIETCLKDVDKSQIFHSDIKQINHCNRVQEDIIL
jgi:hypothetical protein